jgi:hypothetical protein
VVKGISRQVIVVHSPDPKLFEQAIFILREDTKNVTDEMLLKQAKQAIRGPVREAKKHRWLGCVGWSCMGAGMTAVLWLLSSFF